MGEAGTGAAPNHPGEQGGGRSPLGLLVALGQSPGRGTAVGALGPWPPCARNLLLKSSCEAVVAPQGPPLVAALYRTSGFPGAGLGHCLERSQGGWPEG